jgi:hypothetical protein
VPKVSRSSLVPGVNFCHESAYQEAQSSFDNTQRPMPRVILRLTRMPLSEARSGEPRDKESDCAGTAEKYQGNPHSCGPVKRSDL